MHLLQFTCELHHSLSSSFFVEYSIWPKTCVFSCGFPLGTKAHPHDKILISPFLIGKRNLIRIIDAFLIQAMSLTSFVLCKEMTFIPKLINN